MSSEENRCLLSICIPTYARRELVTALVSGILAQEGPFEVRVHVDGDVDATVAALEGHPDPRLFVTTGPNMGRASALRRACQGALGKYIMIFDDDDTISDSGLRQILADCAQNAAPGSAGFIYHFSDESGVRLGDAFPARTANLISLRSDFHVRGDKKEVVLTSVLKPNILRFDGLDRRIPTSLYWTAVALEWDIACRDVIIGTKNYLSGGMTASIWRLKLNSSRQMYLKSRALIAAYRRGRYSSRVFFAKAIATCCIYYLVSRLQKPPRIAA